MATFRCPECRTRRTTWPLLTAHIRTSGHAVCTCGGYHYPHRAGSPACEVNTLAPYHRAAREGATPAQLEDVLMDCVWNSPGRLSVRCPI